MVPFFAVILLVAAVLGGVAAHHWRSRRRVDEAVRHAQIADLEPGRFRIAGRIQAERTLKSPLDGANCVFYEHADYKPTLGAAVMVRESARWSDGVPFYVEDGTGRVRIDPRVALIEASVVTEDGGLTAERRLRVGEEIEVVATFGLGEADPNSPYRGQSHEWCSQADDLGPPRITYRTMPDMVRPTDELGVFMGAASVFLVAVGTLLAVLVSLAS
ncbi:MAG: hypothetical protein AAF411_18130 [Myxococcota bacterium]